MDRSLITRTAARVASAVLLAGVLVASQAASTPVAYAAGHARVVARHAVSCPNASLVPTSANIPQIEAATLCLVNQQRTLHHEHPLRNNGDLASSAGRHSQDMVAANYFDHISPTGETPLRRIRASGYLPRGATASIGENIDLGTMLLVTPAAIVTDWMKSPDHRANILNSDYRDSGIGVVAQAPAQYGAGETGATYTQDFGTIMAPNGTLY
jgi:uncharacterized protein YkwD